ncbi:hypothetical protein AWB92_24795 [Mycobacterium sp. IEC1808]|nr:hypothetical protein AWB92_24795 [Mycobacterium sp. IEC1808]
MLLPDGFIVEANVIISPGLDYLAARHRSVDLAATLGHLACDRGVWINVGQQSNVEFQPPQFV